MNMNNIYKVLMVAVAALFAVACTTEHTVGDEWGYTEYFKSSIFKKYTPVVMEQEIEIVLNEDAAKMFANGGTLNLYLSKKSGENVADKSVVLYVNGKKQPDNKITFDLSDDATTLTAKVGLEFKGEAEEGTHQLYLVADDDSVRDFQKSVMIDEVSHPVSASDLHIDLGTLQDKGFYIIKEDVANPGNVVFWIVVIVIATLLLLWYLVVRPAKWRHLYFSKMYISYPGVGDDIPVTTRGCCRLILTDKPIKQSIFKKIFLIPDAVEVNEVWTSRVTITCRDRRRLRIRGGVMYMPDEPLRGEEIVITTDEGVKVKMNS